MTLPSLQQVLEKENAKKPDNMLEDDASDVSADGEYKMQQRKQAVVETERKNLARNERSEEHTSELQSP